ncbi:DUF4845 domain-containing protein [Acinetobacter qingfengensis]|uniref:DUF4845 domain-containing protein n=1 Tax=Acinetobacter qingfengensis TaxID=1262585 RepID=A0A1E7RF89_9GAMM|nr:DUF4845 domain-containing protein [Acinetobacter qingfengensis]OEY98034.1 hypothetical protein BJI46_00440 [Acinetobacter qingfengensis]
MLKKQRGVSYIGIFIGILLAALALKIMIAIWPAYWDDRIINSEIEKSLQNLSKTKNSERFKQDLISRLSINNIQDIDLDKVLNVDDSDGITIKKDYEVRKHFIGNIDLVLTFKQNFSTQGSTSGGQ